MSDSGADIRVIHRPELRRYEVWSGDELAGFSAYREPDDSTVFTHTEVDSAFSGQGLGSVLVRGALDDVVRRNRTIVPVCPFVARYLRKATEYDERVTWPENGADE